MSKNIADSIIDSIFGSSDEKPSASAATPATSTKVKSNNDKATGVTSGFGYRVHPKTKEWSFHAGVDLSGSEGAPVYAIDDGVVISTKNSKTGGNIIAIDHGGGMVSLYMHLSAFAVESGGHVERGQRIGSVGKTGRVTGPHLHLEVRMNNSPIQPTKEQQRISRTGK